MNQVVESEKLLDEAREMATLIASKPPLAVRAAKEAINKGMRVSFLEGIDVEAYHWSYLCGTEDQKEGARAFIEKRRPIFAGK